MTRLPSYGPGDLTTVIATPALTVANTAPVAAGGLLTFGGAGLEGKDTAVSYLFPASIEPIAVGREAREILTRQGLYCNIIRGGAADATSMPLEECRVPNDLNSPSQCYLPCHGPFLQSPPFTNFHNCPLSCPLRPRSVRKTPVCPSSGTIALTYSSLRVRDQFRQTAIRQYRLSGRVDHRCWYVCICVARVHLAILTMISQGPLSSL